MQVTRSHLLCIRFTPMRAVGNRGHTAKFRIGTGSFRHCRFEARWQVAVSMPNETGDRSLSHPRARQVTSETGDRSLSHPDDEKNPSLFGILIRHPGRVRFYPRFCHKNALYEWIGGLGGIHKVRFCGKTASEAFIKCDFVAKTSEFSYAAAGRRGKPGWTALPNRDFSSLEK